MAKSRLQQLTPVSKATLYSEITTSYVAVDRATQSESESISVLDFFTVDLKSGAGSPVGAVTPDRTGQLYQSTPDANLWLSTGMTNTEWALATEYIGTGSGSPVGAVTPLRVGWMYLDTSADAVWIASGATNADWIPVIDGLTTGAGSPIGAVTPYRAGWLYYATASKSVWMSIGTLNTDWVQVTANLAISTGSPVGVITPDREGALYYDTTSKEVWMAIGLTNNDWIVVAPYRTTTQTATGSYNIDLTLPSTSIDSSGGAVTATLGDGTFIGQTHTVKMSNATTASTLSITNHELGAPLVIPFTATSHSQTFVWNGAVWRNLKPRFTETHDVRAYGAVPDGTTVSYDAIQAAITACPVGGAVVISGGTFLLNNALAGKSGVSIIGNGTLKASTTANIINFASKSDFSVSGITLDAGSTTLNTQYLLNCTSSSNYRITGVTFTGSKGTSCRNVNATNFEISGCRFKSHFNATPGDDVNSIGSDITIEQSSAKGVIAGNRCTSGAAHGIAFTTAAGTDTCRDLTISNNVISGCRNYGILGYANNTPTGGTVLFRNIVINANTVSDIKGDLQNSASVSNTHGDGIYLQGVEHFVCTNNTVETCNQSTNDITTLTAGGIAVNGGASGAVDFVLADNHVLATAQIGIDLVLGNSFERADIRNNSVHTPGDIGIRVRHDLSSTANRRLRLSGNSVENSGDIGIRIQKSDTVNLWRLTMTECDVRDTTGTGVLIEGCDRALVEDCSIQTTTLHGLEFSTVGDAIAINNLVKDQTNRGIAASTSVTKLRLYGNTIQVTSDAGGANLPVLAGATTLTDYRDNEVLGYSETYDINSGTPYALSDGATTIDATQWNRFKTANTTATTISSITRGQSRGTIYLSIADVNTKIGFSAGNIIGNGAADYWCRNGDVIIFRFVNGAWHAQLPDRPRGLNVKDFGAVGDGTTDDTAAFQRCISAATPGASSGRLIYVPRGSYKITAKLVLQNGMVMEGDGARASTLKFMPGAASAECVEIGAGTLDYYSGLRDMAIVLESTQAYDDIALVRVRLGARTKISDCYIDATGPTGNFDNCALELAGQEQLRIVDCLLAAPVPVYVSANIDNTVFQNITYLCSSKVPNTWNRAAVYVPATIGLNHVQFRGHQTCAGFKQFLYWPYTGATCGGVFISGLRTEQGSAGADYEVEIGSSGTIEQMHIQDSRFGSLSTGGIKLAGTVYRAHVQSCHFENHVNIWNSPQTSTQWKLTEISATGSPTATVNGSTFSVTGLKNSDEWAQVATGTYTITTGVRSTKIDSSGGAVTATLGAGDYIGQTHTIVMTDAANASTVSITNHETSDPEVYNFDAVDETLVVLWTGTEWVTLYATATI